MKSKLNDTINYSELKYLSEEDTNFEANLYEMTLFEMSIIIAIGLPKFTYIDKEIVYYPVYIIKNDKVHSQIGLYEIMSNTQPSVLDDDGDVDIEKIGPIQLFSYVNKDYIDKVMYNTKKTRDDADELDEAEDEAEDEADEDEDEAEDEADIEADEADKQNIPITSQDKTQAAVERKKYTKHKNEDWIQTYMQNNNYNIIENEGGGDCLFASIRDGMKRAGVIVTVEELREKLADNATEEVFQGFKNMYGMALDELQNINADIKTREKEFNELMERGKKTKDRDIILALTLQAKEIKEVHSKLKKEKSNANAIANEYTFMDGVDTLNKFKAIIQTCDFWGETWAISTLERILNIKLILFSREAYKSKDFDNVVLCNQLNDTILQDEGVFKPSHYIMLEYLGYHYTLITYKSQGALSFKEIPYDVKTKIVDTCLERNSGVFYLIPDFRDFMAKLNAVPSEEKEEDFEMITLNMYDPTTIFQFYNASASGPAPGKGSGEEISKYNLMKFNELASIPNWRRKLDNFWVVPFEMDGHTWNTVEHYYQASKFKENNPQFYIKFAKDANPEGELSQNPSMAKAAGSVSGKYNGKTVRPSSIKIDPKFYSGRDKDVMHKALETKFTQNDELKQILLLTKDAKLQRFVKGKKPKILETLMYVRKELSNNK